MQDKEYKFITLNFYYLFTFYLLHLDSKVETHIHVISLEIKACGYAQTIAGI